MRESNEPPAFDLRAAARRAMTQAGFEPDMPPEVQREIERLREPTPPETTADAGGGVRDLRNLLWSSVDNPESRDLDQVEFAERLTGDNIRLRVGIADVDALVAEGSATDRHAGHNTTSVYTGVETFPMLPERLSTDLSSLHEGEDRLALVADLVVAPDGTLASTDVYRALVRNHARLDYESIGPWLEGKAPLPPDAARVPGLEGQLRLQDEAMARFQALRRKRGALDFETVEPSPVTRDGRIVDLAVREKNRARYLIENFMVAVNGAVAVFLDARDVPSIQRVVRTPRRWPRIVEIAGSLGERLPPAPDARALAAFLARRREADPVHFPDLSLSIVKLLGRGEYLPVRGDDARREGHFGLAVQGYTHSTAPNRRYADLITQRLLKAVIAGSPPPYSEAELGAIAARCTERAAAANKVERRMRKTAAAVLLGERIGEIFEAIVTGASEKGTYVRLVAPPAEGRVVRGEEGMDVGDKVRVRLVATEPENGFIDFARAR